MWHKAWDGSSWSPWGHLGGALTSGPDAASWSQGRLDVVVRGPDNAMWHKIWNGSSWTQWGRLGGQLTSDPSAVSSGSNRVDAFVRGPDNALWHKWLEPIGWAPRPWSPGQHLAGGRYASGPLLTMLDEYMGSRQLMANLTLRELRTKYKRTLLGWTWSLLNPLAVMAIFTLVFGVFLNIQPPPGSPSGLKNFPSS